MRHLAKSVLFLSALFAFAPHVNAAEPQTATAGPYVITLNQSSTDVKSTGALTITVRKAGKLATDLRPYGGSSGLADFTNKQTRAVFYTTVNPRYTSVSTQTPASASASASPSTTVGGELEISPPAMPSGIYALSIQLQSADGQIYTASFTLDVR
jgi:hypothetical protein